MTISHKSSDRENTCSQNMSDTLIYFHEICLHVIYDFKFLSCKFFTK